MAKFVKLTDGHFVNLDAIAFTETGTRQDFDDVVCVLRVYFTDGRISEFYYDDIDIITEALDSLIVNPKPKPLSQVKAPGGVFK